MTESRAKSGIKLRSGLKLRSGVKIVPKTVKSKSENESNESELTPNNKKIIEETIKRLGVLTTRDQKLIKYPSESSMTLRNPHGTSSCRHLQMLYILLPLLKNKKDLLEARKDLSKLWRHALEVNKELHDFYNLNKVGNIEYTIIGEKGEPEIHLNGSGKRIFPMGLVKSYGDDYHIMHYFLLLIEGPRSKPRYYIYSAYGSDDVCVYPQKIPLDIKEFNKFIDAIHSSDPAEAQTVIRSFLLTYFLKKGVPQSYFHEGRSRKVWASPSKGAQKELEYYKSPFKVFYFPSIITRLQDAAMHKSGGTKKIKTKTKMISSRRIKTMKYNR